MLIKNKNLTATIPDFFKLPAIKLANELLFCVLERRKGRSREFYRIIETEAYTQDDPASHSFRGISQRNQTMFLEGGHLYVYMIYGVHYCLNIVSGMKGLGEAVLIRSLLDLKSGELIVGPGRVCKHLKITTRFDGVYLPKDKGFKLYHLIEQDSVTRDDVVKVSTRIGITKGRELPRRFFLREFERYLPKSK